MPCNKLNSIGITLVDFHRNSLKWLNLFLWEVFVILIDCLIYCHHSSILLGCLHQQFFPRTARLWNSLHIECFPLTHDQDFIQALLLTPVLHEGLSFMAVCHNPTCISMFVIITGGSSHMNMAVLLIWCFKIAFACIFGDLIFSIFRSLFTCVRLAWWLCLPTTYTKWQVMWTYHFFFKTSCPCVFLLT